MCLALALTGHQLTKVAWEYHCSLMNKKVSKPEPSSIEVKFKEVKTGEMVFWRGDLPHRHIRHNIHSAIIQGNMKFGNCNNSFEVRGMRKSLTWLTKYITDVDDMFVEGTKHVEPEGYVEGCLLYSI